MAETFSQLINFSTSLKDRAPKAPPSAIPKTLYVMMNLTEIELEIRNIANLIDAPEQYLPTFGYTEGTARPHIETQGIEFHYVINERGEEYKRIKTEDFKELTFLVFSDVTFEMSVKIELENRKDNEDFRIQMFQIQEDLLNKIDPSFSERLKVKHNKLLNRK